MIRNPVEGKRCMPKSTIPFFLVWALMAGCVTIADMSRLNRFNDTAKDYQTAMRWSDFETVNRYRQEEQADGSFERVQALKKEVQIISYEVRDASFSAARTKVRQVVEIRYFRHDHMIEKTLRAEENWFFDPDQQRWMITGDFPDFK